MFLPPKIVRNTTTGRREAMLLTPKMVSYAMAGEATLLMNATTAIDGIIEA